uniref:Uncharacterized protein n=1 Tax=Rhizophora mucronata TaxID=61149 RepID=A0A2P2ITQ9_RHIMU
MLAMEPEALSPAVTSESKSAVCLDAKPAY